MTLPAATLSKQQLFDVWHTHTAQCQVCQKALTRINWVRRLVYGAAIALFGLALMIDASAIASSDTILTAVAANRFLDSDILCSSSWCSRLRSAEISPAVLLLCI
ncbi:MAG: hypothetical protein AAFQ74_01315 [Cyanobacteria bacterium J06623_4]